MTNTKYGELLILSEARPESSRSRMGKISCVSAQNPIYKVLRDADICRVYSLAVE